MVRRIYVEKKKGFDVEAEALFNDVKENLHIDKLEGVRILNRYDVDGIDDSTYEAAKFTVFAAVSYTHLDVYKRQLSGRA